MKSIKKSVIKPFKSNTKHIELLIKVGRISAAKAILESKVLGLSIVFMQKGVLYKESPDGKKPSLKSLQKNVLLLLLSKKE